jgi:CRISPR-associated endoribonuclease Cas6
MKLGHTEVPVEGVEIEPIDGFSETKYRTMSPIYVSTHNDGSREDLMPDDGMWYSTLVDSIRNRMEAINNTTISEFFIEDIDWWKTKRLRVAENGWVQCARMGIEIRTDKETSKFIQQEGLGERSGLGFGCVMPVEAIPAEWR